MEDQKLQDDVCKALLEQCAREMGVTLEGIAKSPHRKALREVVEQAARQKLAAALERALPIPRTDMSNTQAQMGMTNTRADTNGFGRRY